MAAAARFAGPRTAIRTGERRGASSEPRPASPASHGGRPASLQPRGHRLAWPGGPSPHSLQPRPGPGDAGRRMSPWSWLLLPTLCLLLTRAAPRPRAPASADCELKPQVRRVWHRRAGGTSWMATFRTPRRPAHLVPEPTLRAGLHLPRRRLLAGAYRSAPGPLLGAGAVLQPHETLSPSPRHSSAQGRPAGVSWFLPARVGAFERLVGQDRVGPRRGHLYFGTLFRALFPSV